MRKTCLDHVYELAKQDDRVVFIGSDLGVGTLKKFRDEMPDRFFMEGIAEGHVMGMAAGLALEGKIVYVNTISTFLTRRCYEQIVLDVCLHNLNVRMIGNGGGMVYAPLGPTHLAIEDMAIMRAVPNMTLVAPADATEMKRLMPATLGHRGPMYIRFGKGGDPIVTPQDEPFVIGKGMVMREGGDILLVTTGITLKIALEAAERFSLEKVGATVLHLPTVKPIDADLVQRYVAHTRAVVTVEEGVVTGGLGSAVAEIIAETPWAEPKQLKRLGIPDVFPEKYGSQENLMNYYRINADEVVSAGRALLNRA